MATVGYLLALSGAQAGYYQTFKVSGVDLLTAAQTLIIPSVSGKRFIPRDITIRLTSVTGVIIIAPIVRLGNNGSFNNIAPLLTLVAAATHDVQSFPLNTQVTAVDINSTGISVDVQTTGTGATVLVSEVVVTGLVV